MDSNMKSVLRNYIKKCGEGRGLDKFLRRNSYSSDERETSSSITTSKAKCQTTKSLESLNEPETSKSPKESVKHKTPSKTKEEGREDKPMEQPKVVVKQCGEKVDKKKSFSYESVIEITLPQQQQQNFAHLLPTPLQEYLNEKSFGDEKIEEPIKPIISTPKSAKMPAHASESDRKISPSSANDESFVSNKQNPMEWDSYLPGYEMDNSQLSMQLCNPPIELDDKELGVLKTYFKQRGLELPNENIIVVIKNRTDTVSESDKRLEHIRRNKEKWQNIYEKYKEKYQQQQHSVNFQNIDAQSTPKVETASRVTSEIVMNEKGSQTSLVRSSVKGIQVESSSAGQSHSKNVAQQTTLDTIVTRTNEQFETLQNASEVAESFEFVHGSLQNQSKKSVSSESNITEAGSSRNSGLSMSIKNEDISDFDNSLKVAIALLNSLLESKMRSELKRNLAEKVIQKIVQMQTSRSIQTSTLESSNFYAPSHSNSSEKHNNDEEEEETTQKERPKEKLSRPRSRDEALKECLGPMTKSEQSHQSEKENNSINKTSTSISNKSMAKSQLVDFVKREKQSQLKWIEKEIEHLNNLRDLLRRNETPLSVNESCPLYENISMIQEKENYEKSEFKVPKPPQPKAAAHDNNAYNSHANMKRSKNRSKIETPHSDPNCTTNESLASFIDNRSKKFLEKYGKHQKKNYEDENPYTHPCSIDSKKIQEGPTKQKRHTQMTANKDVQTSTSLASSSVFESSSESLSVAQESTSKTTTHYQPEPFPSQDIEIPKKSKNTNSMLKIKQRVAITQTTDSICRTKPIYEARDKVGNFGTTSTTATQRVKKIQNDKQLQAHPPSVKYTLTFDKKSKPKVRPYASLPQQQCSNDYATITKSSKDIYNQISYSASLNYYCEENKENYDNDVLFDDNDDDECVDLQKCFNKKRPEIFTRFEQRKKCIEELKKLRALRNEHRAKLLLLTSEKSLEGKLFSSLPELPLKHTRIFSTKALKLQTKKMVRNLNEVQQKKKEENIKNLKKKTRLMTEIFNKNLQRNVLKGNLNLSNTVNLITK